MQTNTELKIEYLPIEDIINLYPKWFGKNERRLFKSKWDNVVYKLGDIAYFISSEKFGNEARKYTIRRFNFTDKYMVIGEDIFEFQRYNTKIEAKNALLNFLKEYITIQTLLYISFTSL